MRQLPLVLALHGQPGFNNFHPGRNQELLARLRALAQSQRPAATAPLLFIWGGAGVGKTHLLQAAARQTALRAAFVPLDAPGLTPAVFEQLEGADLVCIDALERIAGARAWELALFNLYERIAGERAQGRGAALIVAARANPRALPFALPDLATRLSQGLTYELHDLADADKRAVLCRRARERGLDLPAAVADYLLARYARDMHALMDLLDRIDRAALAHRRRLTVPFIRSLD